MKLALVPISIRLILPVHLEAKSNARALSIHVGNNCKERNQYSALPCPLSILMPYLIHQSNSQTIGPASLQTNN